MRRDIHQRWPARSQADGSVDTQELENMVERAVLMAQGRVLMPIHFSAKKDNNGAGDAHRMEIDLLSLPFHKSVAELERRLIEKAIQESGGNKFDAANRLQINRRLLYNKMEEYKIE